LIESAARAGILGGKPLRVPFIVGDGIGPDIMAATRRVLDEAVFFAGGTGTPIEWLEVLAGERAMEAEGSWLPEATLDTIRSSGVAIKGPLTTPVAGGIRSLNVALRQRLDLYASVRPIRYFEGVPSPVKDPGRLDVVIFRENTEDVYKGIEWKQGSKEAESLMSFLSSELGVELAKDTGIGLKPMSEHASKRLIKAAIDYAIGHGRPSVTLVHKGNIMKFTEGAFKEWGYGLAREEYPERVVIESERTPGSSLDGKVLLNDRIADNMFQQILTRPDEYSVLAAPNLNGDYLADACAAQVGGLGLAPGGNYGDGVAVFEPVHGTAPKYGGKDVANPCALMLSGAMMLDYLGLTHASRALETSIASVIADGVVTQDLAKMSGSKTFVRTSEFADAVIGRLASGSHRLP
jgi:isocitrate dehydrogenase